MQLQGLYDTDFTLPKGAKLPVPTGYRILIMIPKMQEKTAGGIIRPQSTTGAEQTASIAAKVISMGEDAYCDMDKFPNGPWCKVGDIVMFRAYSGTKFEVGDREFRLINDDTVDGIVPDISILVRK